MELCWLCKGTGVVREFNSILRTIGPIIFCPRCKGKMMTKSRNELIEEIEQKEMDISNLEKSIKSTPWQFNPLDPEKSSKPLIKHRITELVEDVIDLRNQLDELDEEGNQLS